MAEGGKHCIIGIFDVIHAPQFPVVHAAMALALRLRGTPHEMVPLKIELGRPNGDVLGKSVQADVKLDEAGSYFINMNVTNTEFPEQGRYTIKISSGGHVLASHSLRVQKMQQTQPVPPQGNPQTFH